MRRKAAYWISIGFIYFIPGVKALIPALMRKKSGFASWQAVVLFAEVRLIYRVASDPNFGP